MPPKKGYTDLHIPLPDDLTQKLEQLAVRTGKTRKQLIENACIRLIEGSGDETMLAGLHQRLDTLATSIDTLAAAISQQSTRTESRMEKMESKVSEIYEAMAGLLAAQQAPTNGKGWFARR